MLLIPGKGLILIPYADCSLLQMVLGCGFGVVHH